MLVLAVDDLFLVLFMLVVRSRLLSADTGGGIDMLDDGDCGSVDIDVANVRKEDGGEVQ